MGVVAETDGLPGVTVVELMGDVEFSVDGWCVGVTLTVGFEWPVDWEGVETGLVVPLWSVWLVVVT